MKKPEVPKKKKLKGAAACYIAVVRSFVTSYCGTFEWQGKVLGFLRARNFALLLEHAEQVNSELICSCTRGEYQHKVYADADSFKSATQYVALVRSYQFSPSEIEGLDPDAAAIEDFLSAERRNRRLNKVFAAHLKRGTERHWCIPLIREVFCRVLGRTPHYEDIFNNCDYSGGASVGISGDDTHMANKLCAPVISGTSTAFEYYEHGLRRNMHYLQVLEKATVGDVPKGTKVDSFRPSPIGSESYISRILEALRARYVDVSYDEIKVVPKKAKSGRTILKNPPVNNFVQKGVDKVQRALLKRTLKIDLSDQLTNQIMAGDGSLGDLAEDPYVTIDVRGASNSVITELVRSVCPPRWFKLMNRLRSPSYKLPDGTCVPYEMFVGMGNGFCFPLESLLFAAIVLAATKHCGGAPDFRVYGDDIICRARVALVVLECLRACGFRTNVDKTYVFGPFRESCGANWYDGRLVTPGYYKERIYTLGGLHALHNALFDYPLTQEVIRGLQLSGVVHMVPNDPMFDWVTDQAFRVSQDLALTNASTYYNRDMCNFAYPIMVGSPVPDGDWEKGAIASREGCSEMLRVAAALRGSTFGEPFHLRRTTRYRSTNTMDPAVAELAKLIKKLAALGYVG